MIGGPVELTGGWMTMITSEKDHFVGVTSSRLNKLLYVGSHNKKATMKNTRS